MESGALIRICGRQRLQYLFLNCLAQAWVGAVTEQAVCPVWPVAELDLLLRWFPVYQGCSLMSFAERQLMREEGTSGNHGVKDLSQVYTKIILMFDYQQHLKSVYRMSCYKIFLLKSLFSVS